MTGARLVKRMTFALFSGETDQYVSFLPDIQGTWRSCSHSMYVVMIVLYIIIGEGERGRGREREKERDQKEREIERER